MRILHMLNWKLKDIETVLDVIKGQNFDTIQINPIQPLKEDDYSLWWLSYQPCGFDIGNIYGSKEDLKSLCFEANKRDIRIIADVICNHMAGANDGSLNPHPKVDRRLTENSEFWKEKRNISNWHDRYQVTHYCMGLPGLNPANHELQNIIIDFLNELLDCGVSGFRFDAAKNIALPEENCDFWPRIIYGLNKYGVELYGEVIFEGQELFDKYSKFFKILTNENPKDIINSIKFCESHDSYLDFGYTQNIPSNVIAYQYKALANNYPNTLFYVRPFDNTWQNETIQEGNKQKVLKKGFY